MIRPSTAIKLYSKFGLSHTGTCRHFRNVPKNAFDVYKDIFKVMRSSKEKRTTGTLEYNNCYCGIGLYAKSKGLQCSTPSSISNLVEELTGIDFRDWYTPFYGLHDDIPSSFQNWKEITNFMEFVLLATDKDYDIFLKGVKGL